MKQKSFVIQAIGLLFLCAVLLLSACGRNRDDETPEGSNGLAGGLQLTHDTQSLTVSVPLTQEPRFRRAGESLRQSLADEGIHLDFNLIYFLDENWEENYERLLSQFAAGVGPDVITGGFSPLPIYRFVENGFLADIYALMDADPHSSRDSFFTNALQPLEMDGRLYSIPMQFGFSYIGINANAPQSFIERFAALEYASPSALMQLHADLIYEHPEWSEFAFIHGVGEYEMFVSELDRLVDFAAQSVNLSGGGVGELLENMQRAFADNDRFNTQFTFPVTEEFLAELQGQYLFLRPIANEIFESFLDFEETFFTGYIPLADESGRLVQRGFSGTHVSVSQNANPALAWAFIAHLISDAATEEFRFTTDIPITRRYLRSALETSIQRMFSFDEPRPFTGSRHDVTEQIISRLEGYSTKPTAYRMGFSLVPLPSDGFFEFMHGGITAEEAVSQMEADIRAWFNADRPIAEYVPLEEDQPWTASDLPARTLTVLASNQHAGVLQQAANAMNAAWRARNEPYVFELIIDEHDWTDQAGVEERNTRLQTQLMAGQGPDMFTILRLQNMHALADSGFLADIYTLMDNDPRTSRDDFFMEALAAFEMGGGLYVFPTNFGFQYVAINTKLPQHVISRFAQYETITIGQMMEIYLYVMDNHAEEFGHLILATSSGGVRGTVAALEAVAGGFIDFNTRSANLTDPSFVSFLESFLRVADGREVIQSWGVGLHGGEDWRRGQAEVSVFMIENSQLTPIHAFIPQVNPIFSHHALLVDDQGRLLLDDLRWSQSIWSAFCITAAGDSALAWEFLQYVIPAYSEPVGRAGVDPVFGAPIWGSQYLNSPVQREVFQSHTRRAFNLLFERGGNDALSFINAENPEELSREIEAGINRLAELNEKPMGMLAPMIPQNLFEDDFELLMLGAISASDFAQRMQNSVALWLME